jgi:hypothetical protein
VGHARVFGRVDGPNAGEIASPTHNFDPAARTRVSAQRAFVNVYFCLLMFVNVC